MKVRIGNYKSEKAKKPRVEKVQIHPWDTYSAYRTLGLVIYPVLLAFKKDVLEKGAVPHEFLEPVDVEGLSEEEATKVQQVVYGEAEYRWVETLDKMIWAFEQIKDDFEGEEKFFSERKDVPMEKFEDRYDIDHDGLNDYYEKIDEGLNLFARYYRSLWW